MGNHNGIHLVKRSILEGIYDRREKLDQLAIDGKIIPLKGKYKSLQIEASKHSAEIELAYHNKSERHRKRREFSKNLGAALEWGIKDYDGVLTESFIIELGERIEPKVNMGGYRILQPKLRTKDGFYSPPSPEKVEREIDYFLFENHCIDDPVERAIHAHFHISRIHPLTDGNGRTARLTQNIMLEYNGFLPIVLKGEDRRGYIDAISEASKSYKDATSHVNVEENYQYARLSNFLGSEVMNLKDFHGPKFLCLSLLKQKTTPNKNNFYNYVANVLKESYYTQLEKAERSRKTPRASSQKRRISKKSRKTKRRRIK